MVSVAMNVAPVVFSTSRPTATLSGEAGLLTRRGGFGFRSRKDIGRAVWRAAMFGVVSFYECVASFRCCCYGA